MGGTMSSGGDDETDSHEEPQHPTPSRWIGGGGGGGGGSFRDTRVINGSTESIGWSHSQRPEQPTTTFGSLASGDLHGAGGSLVGLDTLLLKFETTDPFAYIHDLIPRKIPIQDMQRIPFTSAISFVSFRGVHGISYGLTSDGMHLVRFPVPATRARIPRIFSPDNPRIDTRNQKIVQEYTSKSTVFLIEASSLVSVSSIITQTYICADPTTSRDIIYVGIACSQTSQHVVVKFDSLRNIPVTDTFYGALESLKRIRPEYF